MPSLLSTIGRGLTKSVPTPQVVTSLGPGHSGPSEEMRGGKEMLASYRSWVYAAATVRAQASSKLPIHLYRGNDTEIDAHPFLDLWRFPASTHHEFEWRMVVTLQALLAGNAYLYKARDPFGGLKQLVPMPPDRMKVVPADDSPRGRQAAAEGRLIMGYLLMPRHVGRPVAFDFDEIVHIKRPNPGSLYYGLGIVQAAASAVYISEGGHEYGVSNMRNRAYPGTIVTTDADIPEAERRKMARMFEEYFKGPGNGGRTSIFAKGLDIKRVQLTPVEIDYLATMRFTRDEIFAMFGVPRSTVGMSDDVNRANAESGNIVLAEWAADGDIRMWTGALNAEVLPEFEANLHLEFESPIPEDESSRAARIASLPPLGAVWANEGREMAGLDADPALDGFLIGPTGLYRPEDIGKTEPAQPGDDPATTPTGDAGTEGDNASEEQATDEKTSGGFSVPGPRREGESKDAPLPETKSGRGDTLPVIDALAADLTAELRSYFSEAKARTVGRLRNDKSALSKGEHSEAFKADDERRRLEEILAAALLLAYASGVSWAKRLLEGRDETPTGFDETWPDAKDMVEVRARQAAEVMTATTARQLAAAIGAAQAQGESLPDIIARVEHVFEVADSARAATAGLQETSSAFHVASVETWKRSGVRTKAAYSAGDGAVCEDCSANESEGSIPISQAFYTGDQQPPFSHIDGSPGCRCEVWPD